MKTSYTFNELCDRLRATFDCTKEIDWAQEKAYGEIYSMVSDKKPLTSFKK